MTNMPDSAKHQVAQWRWETTFDDQNAAHNLQDLLSEWSHSSLSDELNRALEEFCPCDNIWRIPKLTLDLGDLLYEDLQRELPRHFRNCLEEELRRLLLFNEGQDGKGAELVTPRQSGREVLHCVLINGIMPWWFARNKISLKQLLEDLLREQPEELASLLRETGKREKVRKRMVWQCGEPLIREIIRVLEPYHYKTILSFANHLVEVREKEHWDRKGLEQHRWLWILKHLLVERGTLFNTVMFVKQTIRQMANHYQMDYDFLLHTIVRAVQETKKENLLVPVFLSALLEIADIQKEEAQPVETPTFQENLWRLLERLLQKGRSQETIAGEQVKIGELFAALAAKYPKRMAVFLPMVGREPRTVRHMVSKFNVNELECVLRLVAQENHPLILTHIHHVTEGLARNNEGALQKKQQALVWEVALSYLFQDRGSYFNRREFVKTTLNRICKREKIHFLTFLLVLSSASYPTRGALSYNTELLSIFWDLLREEEKRMPLQKPDDDPWRHLRMFLMHGKKNAHGDGISLSPKELFALLLRRSPARVKELILLANAKEPSQFHIRLLRIIHCRDLPFLLRLLSPDMAELALSFLARFQSWNVSKPLECLQGINMPAALHEVVLYTLLNRREEKLSSAAFVEALMKHLINTHSIHSGQWNAELSIRLRDSGASSQEEKLMALALDEDARMNGRPPSSFASRGKTGLITVTQELLAKQPQLFPQLLQSMQKESTAMARLFYALDFEALVHALGAAHPELGATCSALKGLHRIGLRLGILGVGPSEFNQTLMELILECWRTSAWERLAPGRLWQELAWLMVRFHRVSPEAIEHAFQEWKHLLPPGIQLVRKSQGTQATKSIPDTPKPREQDHTEPPADMPIEVSNAGLVLLQQYIPLYLERLQLVGKESKTFQSDEAKREAVHYLQLLATGQRETEEIHLTLNKVLCGLPLSESLEAGIDPEPTEMELAEGLIRVMSERWPAIGATSLEGFRGNWLVRQGTLREKENMWDLNVEKRGYDILLNKAPFTFSIIKFKWMEKSIQVNWSY